ncbi:MAG: hypothetical protein J7L28_03665, partial [Thermotogae bacterium]|nr:hypothetical protein [Thermotogota bacterium]
MRRKEGFALPLILILVVSISLLVGGVVSLTTGMTSQYNVYKYYEDLKMAEMNALHYGLWILNKDGLGKFTLVSDTSEFTNETGVTLGSNESLYVFSIKDNDTPEVNKEEVFKFMDDYPYIYVLTEDGVPKEIYSVVKGLDYAYAEIKQEMDAQGFLSKMAYVSGNEGHSETDFGPSFQVSMDISSKFGVSDHEAGDFAAYLKILKILNIIIESDLASIIESLFDINLEDVNLEDLTKTGEEIRGKMSDEEKPKMLVQSPKSRGIRIWKEEEVCVRKIKLCPWSFCPEVCVEWDYRYVLDLESTPVLQLRTTIYRGDEEGLYYDYISFSSSGTSPSDEFFENAGLSQNPIFVSHLATEDIEHIQTLALGIDLEAPSVGWTRVSLATITEYGFFNYGATEVLERALRKVTTDDPDKKYGFLIGDESTNITKRTFIIYDTSDPNEYRIIEWDLLSDYLIPQPHECILKTATYVSAGDVLMDATLTCDGTPSTIVGKPYVMLFFKGDTIVGDIDGLKVSVPMVIISSETAYLPNDVEYNGYNIESENDLDVDLENAPTFILVSGESIIALKKVLPSFLPRFEDLNLMGSYYSLNGAFYWDHLWNIGGISAFVKLVVDAIEYAIESLGSFLGLDIEDIDIPD